MGSSSIQSQDQPHWVGRVDFLKLSSKLETLRGESGAINIYTRTMSINEDVCSTPEWLKYELKKKGMHLRTREIGPIPSLFSPPAQRAVWGSPVLGDRKEGPGIRVMIQ